jgi:ABC-2 type transport system permease protein
MVLSIVLVISGFGLTLIGVVPGLEEVWRLLFYLIISSVYISFWLGLAILFSITFKSIATSALASVALWIFLSFFVSLGADVLANAVAPAESQGQAQTEDIFRNARVKELVSLCSPMVLYSKASSTIIDPMRKTTRAIILMGPRERASVSRFQNPLPLAQSLIVVSPHFIALVALTFICFAISYILFMLQEIRT